MFGNEGGDDQGIDGQPRGTSHEGGDQDGGDAIALALDGARGHDGGHGAGIGRKQRDEALALQADAGHGPVGDEGRAREIAGVLQDHDKKEKKQDLRQEHDYRSDAAPHALHQQRAPEGIGQLSGEPAAGPGDELLDRLHHWARPVEDRLKYRADHEDKDQRSPRRVQEEPIQAAGPG